MGSDFLKSRLLSCPEKPLKKFKKPQSDSFIQFDLCYFLSFYYNCDVPVCALAILPLNITLLNSVNIPVFTLKILEALSLQPCLDAVAYKGGGGG